MRREDNNEMRPRRERSPVGDFATRATIVVAIACLGIITLWFGYHAINIVLVIFGGVVMAVLFHTLAEPLVRFAKMPTWAAVLVVMLGICALFALGGWLMAAPISRQFDELSVRLPEAIDRLRSQFLSYKWPNWLMEQGNSAVPDGQKILKQITRAFSITMSAGAAIIIVLFLSLYMAMAPGLYVQGIVRLAPVSYRSRAREVMRELYRMLRIWLLTKLISMAFVAVCVAIGLWLMKVPLALALGLIAGLFEFIPTVGPLLSAVPAVLIAFVHSPMMALYVIILYFAVQWVQNHVTNPLLQQRTLSLPPALTLSLVAVLGTLFGFGGLLLSGPLSVVVVVLVKKLYIEDVLERRHRGAHAQRMNPRDRPDAPRPWPGSSPTT
ncbi:MAG TPA: AI-2E family transporter [Candidatus Limnocylindria bacterium]|nr:AI-2E family transporter [Candidatus Limnocylindria bacterium]